MNVLTSTGIACAAALIAATSCGVFKSSTSEASSESSSKSSSSPSKSSSGSSEAAGSEFQQDVTDHTTDYATEGGDLTVFRRDLGTIAEHYGVTDWEAHAETYVAMGRGLKHAGLAPGSAEALGARITDADETRLAWILAGYREPVR
jgi:hypothetical protein